ncbi:MAG: glycosyl transferase, partial [Clostridiales bacterium]|nr:glycosyl transferase [Clostridiales bacterium]
DVEIWSLAAMLKIALIENIRGLCAHINKTQTQYAQARAAMDGVFVKKETYEEAFGQFFKGGIHENTSLIESLFSGLKKHGKEGAGGLRFIDARLNKLNTNSEAVVAAEHQRQTARQVSTGNAITSLRFILALDYTRIFESLSQVEKILNGDVTGIYPKMDKKTKNFYGRNVARIAKRFDITEVEAALSAVELARQNNKHVGHYLIETDLGAAGGGGKKLKRTLYRAGIAAVTLLLSTGAARYCFDRSNSVLSSAAVFVMILLPASDIAVHLFNYIAARATKAATIPRLELVDGIPREAAAFVVISALLTNEVQARRLARQLEIYYLANRQRHIYFGLLSDFGDSRAETTPEDAKILAAVSEVIDGLNAKYGGGFFLFHRKRVYNAYNKIYMGWERKRGAIVAFCGLLRGEKNTGFTQILGDTAALPKIKYVITLDADTKLPRDSAKELIGAMTHPLNTPVIKNGRVVSGYAVMQPKIDMDIESANTSFFSRVFAGQGGIDTYSGAVSDVYQDLFDEGIFTGKGIFDVDVFHQLLPKAVPENTVLSHDLLEGCYLRCALVSDVAFTDGFPWKYTAYAVRAHRWTRGDWQLLPWLTGKVKNPLSAVSKWKIFDNLRRSLVPVALTAVIFLAFNVLPGDSVLWVGFAFLTLCFSLLISTVDWAVHAGYRYIGQRCNATIIYGIKGMIFEALLLFILLPHHAYVSADAAIRALYRMRVSKKKMLEWVTAADADKTPDSGLRGYYRRMLPCCIFAAALYLCAAKSAAAALTLSALWLAAPAVMYRASQSAPDKKQPLKKEDEEFLTDIARRTWRYFADFTVASDNYLAPDNFQENPPNGAAHRTSPTNIGLHLGAVVCAEHTGLIGEAEAVELLEKIVGTMERLEKWNGHFYNWYNTKTLEPLRPRYVSTVDSGNL